MIKISELVFTSHVLTYRANRLAALKNNIRGGLGEEIVGIYYEHNTYHYLSNTGIAFVVDNDGKTVVTLYAVDYRELKKFFEKRANEPKYIRKRIAENYNKNLVRTFNN